VLALPDALKPIDPPPLPVAPLVTVNQPVSLLTAVQAQPAGAVTLVEPLARLALTAWLVGLIAYVQGAAACVTFRVCPPIVSEPLRWVPPGLAPTLKPTAPPPFPLAPLVTVSQEVLLLTPVHAQPVGAVTAADAVPPAAATDWLVGLIE
jgi:hypothetical protein